MDDHDALDHLVACLSAADPALRAAARTALYRREADLTLPVLRTILAQDDRPAHHFALRRLAAFADPVAFATLVAALSAPQATLRQTAAEALGHRGDRQAVSPLLQLLEGDPAALVRVAAVDALALLGDVRALPRLVAALNDVDLRVQTRAAWAVIRFGAAAVDPVIAVLQDPGASGRSWAAVALGRLENLRALAPLLAARHDPDTGVRASVVGALGHFVQPEVERALIVALDDAEGQVRWAAARGLEHVGTAAAVEPLIAHLADPWPDVWGAAASALGAIGDRRAVEPLIRRLQQQDERSTPTYRIVAVIEALGQVGDRRALPALLQVQRHEQGEVETDDEPLKIADVAATAIRRIMDRISTATAD